MSNFRGWVSRLEGRAASDTVTIPQVDGSVAEFEAGEFFSACSAPRLTPPPGCFPKALYPMPFGTRRLQPGSASRRWPPPGTVAASCGGQLNAAAY
jgi:hypothetical protein